MNNLTTLSTFFAESATYSEPFVRKNVDTPSFVENHISKQRRRNQPKQDVFNLFVSSITNGESYTALNLCKLALNHNLFLDFHKSMEYGAFAMLHRDDNYYLANAQELAFFKVNKSPLLNTRPTAQNLSPLPVGLFSNFVPTVPANGGFQ